MHRPITIAIILLCSMTLIQCNVHQDIEYYEDPVDDVLKSVYGRTCNSAVSKIMIILMYWDVNRKHYNIICEGTLIQPTWVLTAGQCTYNPRELYAAPAVNIESDIYTGDTIKVVEVVSHPNYNDWNKNNDIALVKIATKVLSPGGNKYVDLPPKLLHADIVSDLKCKNSFIMGIGKVETETEEEEVVEEEPPVIKQEKRENKVVEETNKISLLCFDVNLMRISNCETFKSHKEKFLVSKRNNMCTECRFPQKGLKNGGLGGPLICNGKQYGILSARMNDSEHAPCIYTRIDRHLDFIHQYTVERAMRSAKSSCSRNVCDLSFFIFFCFIFVINKIT